MRWFLIYCNDLVDDFLGYSFQPRTAYSKKKGNLFIGYDCAISISSRKRIADKLEELNVNKLTFKSIVGVAQYLNPMIRGWVRYYGKFKMFELTKVFRLLSKRLVWWARWKWKWRWRGWSGSLAGWYNVQFGGGEVVVWNGSGTNRDSIRGTHLASAIPPKYARSGVASKCNVGLVGQLGMGVGRE